MAYQLSDLAAMDTTVTLSKPKNGSGEKTAYTSPFSSGEALPVVITGQDIKVTKNGFLQLELARSVIREDGSEVKAGRVWINMPVFTNDKASSLSNEDLVAKTDSFGKRLHDILRAADPEKFSIYKEIDRSTKPWTFVTHSGDVLDNDGKQARAEQIGAEIIAAAKAIVTGQMNLVGKRFYMQEVPGKGEGQTYLNCYAELPEGK